MSRPISTKTAPKHLSAAAKRLYSAIVADYVLEPHHLAILTKALEAYDRAETARDLVTAQGLVVTSRLGETKPHPAVVIERDSRAAFLGALKQLGLDIDGPPPPSARRR